MNNGIFGPPNFSIATDLVGIKPLLGIPQPVSTPRHFPPVNDFRIGSSDGSSTEDVVLVVDTVKGGSTTVILYAPGGANGAYSVDWGDGTSGGVIPIGTANIRRVGSYETRFETTGSCDLFVSHTYAKHGIYRIVVKGVFSVAGTVFVPAMNNTLCLISVESFGREVNRINSLNYNSSTNLVSVPPYLPTGLITSLNSSFFGCSNLTRGMTTWDTSRITNMSNSFSYCSNLNINGSWNWDTRNVTNMNSMFYGATINNTNFSGWTFNTSNNCQSMFQAATVNSCSFINWSGQSTQNMFNGCSLSNSTLSGWRITGTTCNLMFNGGGGGNNYMPNWDLRGVTDCSQMFYTNNVSRSGLNDWNVSGVTNMSSMFQFASDFMVADLSNWDISKVTNFTLFMLRGTASSNSDITINNWRIASGAILTGMFGDPINRYRSLSGWSFGGNSAADMFKTYNFTAAVTTFNCDLTTWNTSGINNMARMFLGNQYFTGTGVNTDLRNWDTSSVTDMNNMFGSCMSLITSVSGWKTSKVTNMSNMFNNCSSFRGSGLENWDTSNVTDMNNMFYFASNMNANLSGWNTGKVTNMSNMFGTTYNIPHAFAGSGINDWNVTGVTTVNGMFYQNTVANNVLKCNLSGWNLCNCTDMTNFMTTCNIGSENYDILLNSWATTSTGNPIKPWATGINVHFGTAKYTAASSGARQRLVNYGWTITDGGFQA